MGGFYKYNNDAIEEFSISATADKSDCRPACRRGKLIPEGLFSGMDKFSDLVAVHTTYLSMQVQFCKSD
jgi:hypothetical protein